MNRGDIQNMSKVYAKKKLPWLKIALVLLLICIGIYALSTVVPALGGAIIGAFTAAGAGIYMFFFGAPTYLSVVAAVGITVLAFVLITQRKYFFKQKIADYSAAQNMGIQAPLQGGLVNTNPMQTPIPQQILSDKTEVTTGT